MTTTKTVSPTMQEALDKMKEHGRLDYWRGGWWTYPGAPFRRGYMTGFGELREPIGWYATSHTINALRRRGLIRDDGRCKVVLA